MLKKVRAAIAVGIILCVIPTVVLGQSITSVPNDMSNNRFYSDIFNIKRPGLSVNGFDNGGDNSHGYGLKQILNLKGGNSEMEAEYNSINSVAQNQIFSPYNPPAISPIKDKLKLAERNSNILQCRAFMALAKYIQYKNGQVSASGYGKAIDSLRSSFLNYPYYYFLVDGRITSDAVKSTRSIGDYARAVDLYLALENAYRYYGFDKHDQADSLEYINSNYPRSQSLFGNAQREALLPQQRKRDYSKCFRR